MLLAVVFVFALGVCVGSFVNVLIFRLPESQSVVTPGSRCRSCLKPLAWYENVPLVSFVALRGRCRGCGAPISAQYPLVELAVGVLFAGNFLLGGPGAAASQPEAFQALGDPRWLTGATFTTLLLAIALTDVRTYLIPDELSLGGLGLGLLLSLLPGEPSPLDSFLGALAGGGLLLAVAWAGTLLFGKEAMGGGDIKMLAMIGAFVGWQGVFLTLFVGALLGSVIYGPIALVQRARGAGARAAPEERRADAAASPPSLAAEASGPESVDRGLVPFGFFLAPAAALTFYLADELVRG
ncbi:MAG: A24 family peptidase [Gemmatimonadota bacterium]